MSRPRRALVLIAAGDDPAARDALAGAGWQVDTVSDPEEMAARIASGGYDAVIAAPGAPGPGAGRDDENARLRRTVMFARQVAHDLAQPLTTILARAQLLRSRLKEDDPHHHPVSIICREADRLAELVTRFQQLREMSGMQEPPEATAPRRGE